MRFYGMGVTMYVLARALGTELEKHVDNDTGLTGSFDFSFDFTPDPGRILSFAGTRFDTSGPSLFTAIEDKLGLQLRAKRGNVETLVVDHAERPSEN
jgi:uncharacterized protein (TIGR03435 family)